MDLDFTQHLMNHRQQGGQNFKQSAEKTQNRKNLYNGDKFDIVIGPVANDTTMPVLSDYMAGNISEEVALILLKPQKLANQYAFLTQKGLQCLKYLGGKEI